MLAPKTQGPLAGLIVVDVTRALAGPYCTMILSDLGARVIKVEMPGPGDDSRSVGPFVPNGDGTQTSAYFFSVNRNKESIALSLKSAADRVVFDRLLESADVLVENFTPGTMTRFGYDWPTLHAAHPGLILASVSGFGQSGPYRELPAYDMVVQAMGGLLSLTGEEGGRPTRVGVSIGDLAAGMFGAIGVQAAVIERHRTGLGKHVDVAMLDSQVALLENAMARFQVEGTVPGPIGSRHASIAPFGMFKASDGYLVLAVGNESMFGRLCDVLGLPAAKADERFASNGSRSAHHEVLKVILEESLSQRTVAEWLPELRAVGLPTGPMNDVAGVLQDPQVKARGMLIPLPLPNGQILVTAGSPVQFVGDSPIAAQPAPLLDEHRESLLRELGL